MYGKKKSIGDSCETYRERERERGYKKTLFSKGLLLLFIHINFEDDFGKEENKKKRDPFVPSLP